MNKEVFDKVVEAARIFVDIDSQPTEATKLQDDLGMDSLDQMELAMELEAVFSIAINDEDAETWVTIGNVVATVETRLLANERNGG